MALKLKVPNIVCDGCAETITESITTMEPNAKVEVDVKAKTVTVLQLLNNQTSDYSCRLHDWVINHCWTSAA